MQTEAGRFACEICGRRYRWKQELAGRAVKCPCGTVMSYPAEDPGDLLYDVAPRMERADDGTVHVRGAIPVPQSAATANNDVEPTLAYRAPRADHVGVEGYFP